MLCKPWWTCHDEHAIMGVSVWPFHDGWALMSVPWWACHDERAMIGMQWLSCHDEPALMGMTWCECHDGYAMMGMPWWACHDGNAMMGMSFLVCHNGHGLMGVPWLIRATYIWGQYVEFKFKYRELIQQGFPMNRSIGYWLLVGMLPFSATLLALPMKAALRSNCFCFLSYLKSECLQNPV